MKKIWIFWIVVGIFLYIGLVSGFEEEFAIKDSKVVVDNNGFSIYFGKVKVLEGLYGYLNGVFYEKDLMRSPSVLINKENEKTIGWKAGEEGKFEFRQVLSLKPEAIEISMDFNMPSPEPNKRDYGEIGYKIPSSLVNNSSYKVITVENKILKGNISAGSNFSKDLLKQVEYPYQTSPKELILDTSEGIFKFTIEVESKYGIGLVDRRKEDGSGYISFHRGIPPTGAVKWQIRLRIEQLKEIPKEEKPPQPIQQSSIKKQADPVDYHLNPAHYDIFYGKKECIYLSDGLWKLKKLPGTSDNPEDDEGTREGYWKTEFDDSSWQNQVVPWDWNENYPERWEISGDFYGEKEPFGGVGWYRKRFFVPERYKGYRLILEFRSVDQDATVFVNGKKIGTHKLFYRYCATSKNYDLESFEFDITDAINFGKENVLAVRVFDDNKEKPIHIPGALEIRTCGGIWQPVLIHIEPPIYYRDIKISPKLATSEIEISCTIINTYKVEKEIAPVCELKTYRSERYIPKIDAPETITKLKNIKLTPGRNEHTFVIKINNPVYWDTENPHLYLLELKSKISNKTEILGLARFGFREFTTKENRFFLNGIPIRLRGTDTPGTTPYRRDYIVNQHNCIGKQLSFLKKELNWNFVRCHFWHGRVFYDICDEEGILINQTLPQFGELFTGIWGNAPNLPPAPTPIDRTTLEINKDYLIFVVNPFIQQCYNHPSVVMYNVANEPYDTPQIKMAPYLDTMYNLLKSLDKTRLVAGFSGRYPYKDIPAKTDFWDVHDYTGSFNAPSYLYLSESLKKHQEGFIKEYGQILPMINGEGLAPSSVFSGYIKNFTKMNLSDKTVISRKEYVDFFERLLEAFEKEKPYSYPVLHQIASFKDFTLPEAFDSTRRAEYIKKAIGYKRLIEIHRISDAVEGFNCHSPQLYPYDGNEADDVTLPTKRSIRQASQPLFVGCEHFDKNIFAGDNLKLHIWIVNDTLKSTEDMECKLAVINSEGKEITYSVVNSEKLAPGEKRMFQYKLSLPEGLNTGFYTLKICLLSGEEKLTENEYDLFVLGKKDRRESISTNKKIALGLESNFESIKLKSILDRLNIHYTIIKNWAEIKNFDVLFIAGLRSEFDGLEYKNFESSRDIIEQWISNGGKLVSLDHQSNKPIPGLPSSRIKGNPLGEATFAEIVLPEHPLFKGIPQRAWDTWNGKYGGIFKNIVMPLSECVLVRGSFWMDVGMIVMEAFSGKGLVLASQTMALEKYGTDSVATLFLENLLSYVLSDEWDGKYAERMRGDVREIMKEKDISVGEVFYIDIRKQANMGFKDEVAEDKKGGWTDQGDKDMRHFPVGKRKFLGVPFDIINPEENEGRSCIVLQGKERPYFPEKVTIPVSKQVKRLFFLVSSAYCSKNQHIADILINYKGGLGFAAQRTIPLISGENINDWTAEPKPLPGAKIAWYGINPACQWNTSVYLIEWTNPEPNVEITHIDFMSKRNAVPILLAISAEKF